MPPRDIKGPTRKAVANPFEEQVIEKRFKGVGNYLSNRGPNKAQFQTGTPSTSATDVVEGLINFAGAASDAYKAKLDKKIQEDRIIQTQQAVLGLNPTSEATEAGYEAHMAVGVKNEQIKAQTKLNELAKGTYTDEEWEQVIRDTYAESDANMAARYADYGSRSDTQKLMAIAMAEMMPQITAEREAAKLGQEIEGRITTEQDIIINSLQAGQDPTFLLQQFETRVSALKLTQSQKEGILTQVALQSEHPGAIEMTKGFKGDRETTLFERTGLLQAKEQELQKANAAKTSAALSLEVSQFQDSFINGQITAEEAVRVIDRRNKETGGAFMSKGASTALFNKASAEKAKRVVLARNIEAVSKGPAHNLTDKEKKAALTSSYSTFIQEKNKEIEASGLTGADKLQAQLDAQLQAVAVFGDRSVQQGVAIPSWIGEFEAFAKSNLANTVENFENLEQLPAKHKQVIQHLEQLEPNAFDFYMSKVDGDTADIIRHTLNLVDSGIPEVQAVSRGQAYVRNRVPKSQKLINDAVLDVTEGIDDGLFVEDLPDNMKPFYLSKVREKLSTYPDPSTERAKREVVAHFQDSWTNVGNGMLVKGTTQRLVGLTNLNPASLGVGFKALISSREGQILEQLSSSDFTLEDVVPDVNDENGTVTFRTPDGIQLLAPIPLSEMKEAHYQYKVENERRYQEIVTSMDTSDIKLQATHIANLSGKITPDMISKAERKGLKLEGRDALLNKEYVRILKERLGVK